MKFSLIVPVFNEEDVISASYSRILPVLESLKKIENLDYELIFVNDGSSDKTSEIIHSFCDANNKIKFIEFSRNFGQQKAITAGLDYATGDFIGFIDADLQDPPEVLLEMINEVKNNGYNVAYGTRISREGETFIKKLTSKAFYRVLNSLSEINIPNDTSDFRVIDKAVADKVRDMREESRYFRGLITWVGFNQTPVYFEREKRFAGETKYSLKTLFKLAFDGIFAFSSKPLKIAQRIGTMSIMSSVVFTLYIIFAKLLGWQTMSDGWASLAVLIMFLSGVQLLSVGILGEYIGRLYSETKKRPLYIVKKSRNFREDEHE